jgi:hypothetical protein
MNRIHPRRITNGFGIFTTSLRPRSRPSGIGRASLLDGINGV